MSRSTPIEALATAVVMLLAFAVGLGLAPTPAQSKCVERGLHVSVSLQSATAAGAAHGWPEEARLLALESGNHGPVRIEFLTEEGVTDSGAPAGRDRWFIAQGTP